MFSWALKFGSASIAAIRSIRVSVAARLPTSASMSIFRSLIKSARLIRSARPTGSSLTLSCISGSALRISVTPVLTSLMVFAASTIACKPSVIVSLTPLISVVNAMSTCSMLVSWSAFRVCTGAPRSTTVSVSVPVPVGVSPSTVTFDKSKVPTSPMRRMSLPASRLMISEFAGAGNVGVSMVPMPSVIARSVDGVGSTSRVTSSEMFDVVTVKSSVPDSVTGSSPSNEMMLPSTVTTPECGPVAL